MIDHNFMFSESWMIEPYTHCESDIVLKSYKTLKLYHSLKNYMKNAFWILLTFMTSVVH